jgi:hypothetical protein
MTRDTAGMALAFGEENRLNLAPEILEVERWAWRRRCRGLLRD